MPFLWVDTLFNTDIGNGLTSVTQLMTGLTPTEQRLSQMTLMRSIIGLDLAYTVHDAGEGSQRISIGIGVASQAAVTTAGASLADASVASEFPTRGWVWRALYRLWGFAADQPAIFTRRIDLDIRSRRKLENGEAFLTATNDALEGVASTVNVHGLVRQLWLVG